MKKEETYYCKFCNVPHVRNSKLGKDHYTKEGRAHRDLIDKAQKDCQNIFDEVSKVIVGQRHVLEEIIVAILCDGSALLEGYPGMAKTLMVKTISDVMDLKFSRIQNTPDLMPSDITGTYIIKETKQQKTFEFYKGPIFSNVVLADEINRTSPKTQSAYLEAMQEKQVTAGNKTYKLPEPFFVLATQNPIDVEGTYVLNQAQTDRFMLKIIVDYPDFEEENIIVEKMAGEKKQPKIKKVISNKRLQEIQEIVRKIPIANDIREYAIRIVEKSRNHKLIEYGASPRASINIVLAAKAKALIEGRSFVSEKDIQSVAYPILRHRLILSFDAEKEGKTPDDVIRELL